MTTETKDSEVKWIGTVPADWMLLKMKHYIGDARMYYHAADNKSISNIMSIGDQRNNMREMMDSVHSIMYILILAAFIL